MTERDLINLLNRAAAAIESPDNITSDEAQDLIEDLVTEAKRRHITHDVRVIQQEDRNHDTR